MRDCRKNNLIKVAKSTWKRKEVSEQRLPLQPYVGLAVFSDVSHYWLFHGNVPSISVQGRLLHWFLPAFASEWLFPTVFWGVCFFRGSGHCKLYKWGCSPNVNHYLTLTYLKSLITSCLKSDTANLWILVTLISVPCYRIYQMRIIQRGLLVLWGEKLLVYL